VFKRLLGFAFGCNLYLVLFLQKKLSPLHTTISSSTIQENQNKDFKILIAEDDNLMRKVLKLIFKRAGYQVFTAKDGLVAIEKINLHLPDIIITDIILPFRSGFEIINYVKENFEHMPILVVSGLGEENEKVIEAFTLGADDFVTKPFNVNELLMRVKLSLDKNQALLKSIEL
jgi:two-component system response regulator VicR